MPGVERRPAEGAPTETTTGQGFVAPSVRRTAGARRRAMLAGLHLSWLLHRLGTHDARPLDQCAGRCGALDVEERAAWARRGSCPCRETP